MTIRTVLFGRGGLAIQVTPWLLDSPDHDFVSEVPAARESTWLSSLRKWVTQAGVAVVESGRYRNLPEPVGGRWGLALSVFCDRTIRQSFIDKGARILNVHNGPLPRYRGERSTNWALKNGETSHDVTLHRILPVVDDEPIVAQVTFSTHPKVAALGDVYQRCLSHAWLLIRDALPHRHAFGAVAQDESQVTFQHSRDNHLLRERSTLIRTVWHAKNASEHRAAADTVGDTV